MSEATTRTNEAYTLRIERGRLVVAPKGRWNLNTISTIDPDLKTDLSALGYGHDEDLGEVVKYEEVIFDFANLTRVDTAGAYVLTRAIGCHDGFCRMWKVENCSTGQKALMDAAAKASLGMIPPPTKPWWEPFDRLGRAAERGLSEIYETLVFFGRFVTVLLKMLTNPRKIRWKSVTALIESVGLDALPIVVILSFFIGCVIAFMGTDLLAVFGAKVFVVDLVGIAVLREFAVLITAILLAGRSNSAFTAQIGSMKMRQEIDAMTVIGLDTYETLVAPRALACLVAAPILTLASMLSGLFGGLLVAWTQDISPILFTARLAEVVSTNHFWAGMIKAPFFALVIAIIGCRHGLAVTGSVESLGSRTTTSVVQAIFTVIVVDALFAMLYLQMGF